MLDLSNETPWGVMKFLQIAKEKNLPRMMSIQNVYSLVNRVFDVANSEVSIREKCGLASIFSISRRTIKWKIYWKQENQKTQDILYGQKDLADIILKEVK